MDYRGIGRAFTGRKPHPWQLSYKRHTPEELRKMTERAMEGEYFEGEGPHGLRKVPRRAGGPTKKASGFVPNFIKENELSRAQKKTLDEYRGIIGGGKVDLDKLGATNPAIWAAIQAGGGISTGLQGKIEADIKESRQRKKDFRFLDAGFFGSKMGQYPMVNDPFAGNFWNFQQKDQMLAGRMGPSMGPMGAMGGMGLGTGAMLAGLGRFFDPDKEALAMGRSPWDIRKGRMPGNIGRVAGGNYAGRMRAAAAMN